MESMKWCPDDETCPEPLGQQLCDMTNGGPSQSQSQSQSQSAIDSDIAISPRMGLQSFDLGNIENREGPQYNVEKSSFKIKFAWHCCALIWLLACLVRAISTFS